MCTENDASKEVPVPDKKIIDLPHLGSAAKATISYRKPTIADLKVLGEVRVGVELMVKQCEVSIEVDGQLKDTEWWDKLHEETLSEILEFLEAVRPKRPNSVMGAIPLVWGR